MKAYIKSSVWGLLVCCIPLVGHGAINRQNNLLGKFFVSSVNGAVTCVSDGRILELKKGDSIMARGAIVETPADGNVTLVFSNGTGVYTDEKTRFEVEKFDQEFFTPNNNLRVEPSNSSTIVKLATGRVVISTPRLLSGTTMVYETAHAMVGIRGEKLMIEATEKQTHVAMIAGTATVNPRAADGTFVSIGKRLATGEEAFVKYTIGGDGVTEEQFVAEAVNAIEASAAATAAAPAATVPESTPAAPLGNPITADTEATVLKLIGSARTKLSADAAETSLVEGTKLPKGSLIMTDDASELQLQPFEGTIATIRPNSIVVIEKLSLTTDGGVLTKQTALLALKAGTVVSTIDPAKKSVNDYGVRTPKGIASAQGTSFSVSIEDDEGFSVAATADIVTFTTPAGASYSIEAGNVTITPAGGEPQAPITLAAAVAASPAFAGVVQTALNAVTNVVQNNIGALAPSSATDLITKVANTAAAALPSQASAITTQVITAVNWPSSATGGNSTAATSAVTTAIVSAAPSQAAQIATSAAIAAPSQAVGISSAAAQGSPGQAAQIASAVTQTLVQTTPQGGVTPASLQTAAAVAAAVTSSAPNQAAPVAAAVMQALALASPLTAPIANAQNAATIASAVTTAAPAQAVPVASMMMNTLTQTATFGEATPEVVAQTAATLASAVTVVVPPQAQEVATAVMQLLVQINPNASPAATTQAAGMIAAAVSQAAPGQSSSAITQSVAAAANQPLVSVQFSAAQSTAAVAAIGQQVASISQAANSATQQSNASSALVAQSFSGTPGSSTSSGTTQNSSGGAGGTAGTSGSGGSTASTGGAGGAGGTGSTSGSGSIGGAGGTGGTGSIPAEDPTNSATSIIINKIAENQSAGALADLDAATAAPGDVQFSPDTTGGGGGSVTPTPTVPPSLPIDNTVSSLSNAASPGLE